MMAEAKRQVTPEAIHLEDDGAIPNNPLPLLVYPGAVAVSGGDPAAAFETRFAANDWRGVGATASIPSPTSTARRTRSWASRAVRRGSASAARAAGC
jgi:hypothetical protein